MKLVLITGASTGIGFEAAKFLSLNGFRVLAGVRSDKDFENLNSINENLSAIKIDITKIESINAAFEKVINEFSPKEYFALINNAGIVKAAPLEFVELDDLRWQFEVNVTSQVAVTQKFLPLLREVNEGRIVFTGSNSGVFTVPMNVPYGASKHAMEAIADGFRRELLANSNIKISLLQPGQIKTPIWDKSLDAAMKAKESFPPDVDKLYGKIEKSIIGEVVANGKDKAADPILVSRAIYHALTSKSPKTRYSMGVGAFMTQNIFKRLPDKLMDKILRKVLKY